MWPSLGSMLSSLLSVLETIGTLLWELITDTIRLVVNLLINDAVFNDVVSFVESMPWFYMAGGAAFAAILRHYFFQGEKFRESKPFGIAVAWTEDIILSANMIWYLRGALVPLILMPIIILISFIAMIPQFPTLFMEFVVGLLKLVIRFVLETAIALFQAILNFFTSAINVIKDVVESIYSLCEDIFDALP